MFDDEFLDKLPDDPYEAVLSIVITFIEKENKIPPIDLEKLKHYDVYLEAFALFDTFNEAVGLGFTLPSLTSERLPNITRITNFFKTIVKDIDKKYMESKLLRERERFKTRFGFSFIYQFSDGDIKRIQELINELRDLISESKLFDGKHKERILNKLEGLQKELHKKMSSLDKLWGLIGEAGVVLGKFGEDAKPFVDRMVEIAGITWRTQARAEELPSATQLPLLSYKKVEVKEPE